MDTKRKISRHCLIHGSIWVAVLCGFLFIGSRMFLERVLIQLSPVCQGGVGAQPADSQVLALCQSFATVKYWLAPIIFGSGLLVMLLMVFSLRRALLEALPSMAKEDENVQRLGRQNDQTPALAVQKALSSSVSSAATILALFQSQGRLIDFLQEDLTQYEDAQIGAAVRNIHQGCREVLKECATLAPVLKEPEGSEVTVEAGFDPSAIKMIGNVSGQPPFRGILRHRGWRYSRLEIPQSQAYQDQSVLAPAEVEIL